MSEDLDLKLLDEKDIDAALSVLVQEQREDCEESYYTFFQYAWEVLEPETPLLLNWHVKYLCDLLQSEVERIAKREPKTKDIVVNISPRSLKSRISSVMFPAWVWCKYPHIKFIYASYSEKLSLEHSVDCRKIIQSDWYQERWGDKFKLTSDQNVKGHFVNNNGGFRLASSVHGTITGLGADIIVSDDILDPFQAESEVERKNANDFYNNTLYTRLNDQKIGLRLLIMQRLHEEDVTGYVMSNFKDRYTHIKIPVKLEGEENELLPVELKEYYTDGLFFPLRFDKEVIENTRKSLGEYSFSGQFMQAPSPASGGMFKKFYWNYWCPRGVSLPPVITRNDKGELVTKYAIEVPESWEEKVCGWDMTFKDTSDTDFVVGQKWGRVSQYKFLLAQVRDRLDFPKTVEAVKVLRYSDNKISAVYVEDRANGSAVISQLKRDVPGLIGVQVDTSKTARAMPLLRQAEAGNIFLPHPMIADWVKGFIEEFGKFPLGKHDDVVDCGSLSVNKLSEIKIKVINGFDKTSPKHHREFGINMAERSAYDKLYAVVYQEKNNRISILLAVWEAVAAHLYVIAEHISLNPLPEMTLPALMKILDAHKPAGLRDFDWWCNEIFYGKPEMSSTSDLYAPFNIYPQRNDFFDRYGSILSINEMFYRNAITVHSSCESLANQLNEWYQEGDINSDILDYDKNKGAVMALCHLAGVLIAHKKIKPIKPKEYDPQRMNMMEAAGKAMATGDFTGYATGFRDMPDVGTKEGSYMI